MGTPIPNNDAAFELDEILAATNGVVVEGAARRTVGVFHDSRSVRPGSLFVALHGETMDGHRFVASALEKGASIVMVDHRIEGCSPAQVTQVIVKDTLVAWGALAKLHLERWRRAVGDGRVVAITGSAGKTTTKELTAALLAPSGSVHFSAGNLNNRIGVPAVVFALRASHRFCVLEMGMSLPGELDAITDIAPPDVSVVVNVGVAHAEGVGGREGVMREKGAVYRALSPSGIAVVNADDEYVLRAAENTRAHRRVSFGVGERRSDYQLLERRQKGLGSQVRIRCPSRELSIHLPLSGHSAAIDLCAALATAEAASREQHDARTLEAALATVRLTGRGTVIDLGKVLLIDDTYNANPGSMRSSLSLLAELAGATRRRVAVLGEMKELGALTDAEHESLGDAVADAGVALLIGCGGRIALTLARAGSRGVETVACENTETAAQASIDRVVDGDVVLVKASRSVEAERVAKRLVSHHGKP